MLTSGPSIFFQNQGPDWDWHTILCNRLINKLDVFKSSTAHVMSEAPDVLGADWRHCWLRSHDPDRKHPISKSPQPTFALVFPHAPSPPSPTNPPQLSLRPLRRWALRHNPMPHLSFSIYPLSSIHFYPYISIHPFLFNYFDSQQHGWKGSRGETSMRLAGA